MAITVNTQILGQQAGVETSYCYLYEPLKVVVTESNLLAKKIYVDLIPVATLSGVYGTTLIRYAEFDINPGVDLTFDLMKLALQHHDARVYKFSDIDEVNGESVVSKYKYYFDIYSDVSSKVQVRKLPILGVRTLENFTPAVDQNQPLNEFDFYGITQSGIENKWNMKLLQISLSNPANAGNTFPTISVYTGMGSAPCGGYLIWKSTFGGWMFWGFDLQNKSYSGKQEGSVAVGMFESTQATGGQPFVPVDYTSIENSYSINLKSLGLTSLELQAVAGINFSPAIYYMKPGSEKMELMRLSSASAPMDSQANGGDFSVSLKSISNTGQKTI